MRMMGIVALRLSRRERLILLEWTASLRRSMSGLGMISLCICRLILIRWIQLVSCPFLTSLFSSVPTYIHRESVDFAFHNANEEQSPQLPVPPRQVDGRLASSALSSVDWRASTSSLLISSRLRLHMIPTLSTLPWLLRMRCMRL